MRTILLLFLCCFLFSCAADPAATETEAKTAAPTTTTEKTLAPPPPPCVYLTEATVLSYFNVGVKLPMPGHRSAAVFSSCQYDLEGADWSATLILEMPEPGKQQTIIDEVAGAKGDNLVKFNGGSGKFTNEGRVLTVSGNKHFRLKFSALPKPGAEVPFDEAARRTMLTSMAGSIVGM